jgi:hypothetical protein
MLIALQKCQESVQLRHNYDSASIDRIANNGTSNAIIGVFSTIHLARVARMQREKCGLFATPYWTEKRRKRKCGSTGLSEHAAQ